MSGLTEDVAYLMGGGGCNSENWPDALERADEIILVVERKTQQELELVTAERDALRLLITECTVDGELDPRLFNSYMVHVSKGT